MISIIIPCLNEGRGIRSSLLALQVYRQQGHEIILVDGGSNDDTIAQAQGLCDQIFTTARGRGQQMNAGAAAAQSDILVFLHADTQLPSAADQLINAALADKHWGFFKLRLDGQQLLFRLIETLMNWRSRLSRITTGDQTLFIRRQLFNEINGFPEIELMEDIGISKRLKSTGQKPRFITTAVTTSCRRWQQGGILTTVLLMWRLRWAYFLGSDHRQLARRYRG